MPAKWYAVLWDYHAVGRLAEDVAAPFGVSRQYVQEVAGKAVRRARTMLRGGLEVGP
jgi:hypothetical protein